jgi:hypothetical protein
VLVFRCTQKLRTRLKVPTVSDLPHSTTQLSDWYGNILFVGRVPLVLFISETTMLPVVITLRESKTIVPRFQVALSAVLEKLQMPPSAVRQEVDANGGFVFGPTASRSTVGVLNDLGFLAGVHIESGECGNLLELSLRLSGVPIGPLKHVFPDEAVRMRLAPTAPKRARW